MFPPDTPEDFKNMVSYYNLPILEGVKKMTKSEMERFLGKNCRFAIMVAFDDAGNFVVLKNNFRDWGWELPCGSVEADESFEEAALREAIEETGIIVSQPEPICAIIAVVQSEERSVHRYGIAFAGTISDRVSDCEAETIEIRFTRQIPESTVFLNSRVLEIALAQRSNINRSDR